MKVGDKVVCIRECRMVCDWKDKRTTIGKVYLIHKGNDACADGIYDNKCIIDDKGEYHYFTNAWNQYFRPVRKEKLLRLNKLSNESSDKLKYQNYENR